MPSVWNRIAGRVRGWLGGAEEHERHRRAELELRLSEERFRLATETGKVGVWDWDIVADRITWSGSLFQLHGVSPEAFDGTVASFANLTHPEDREGVMQALDAALNQGKPYELEFRAQRPDGKVVWLYTSARILREGNRPVRMLGATVDITNRKTIELALRESEERFAKAFNASPLILSLSSLETGKLLEVNETFVRIVGYSREEAIGRTTVELDLWANARDHAMDMQVVRGHNRVRNLEFRFKTRQGVERIGLLSAEKLIIGGESYALTVIQDITEREHAEAARHASEQRLRMALRGANAGVWSFTATGAAFWSEEFEALYGYERGAPRNLTTWLGSLHPDDRDRVQAAMAIRLAEGVGEFRQEFRIIHPRHGVRWILDLGRIDRAEDGRVLGLSGINLDITRIKQVEEELREADRRKNEFLATLAHELRNPLAPLRNGLEILKRPDISPDAADRARSMMDRQLQQMVRLIDDLLDLSRINYGKLALHLERIELASILQVAVEISQPLLLKSNQQLIADWSETGLRVNADLTRMAQVFANLLNNASKYTNPGGRISLRARRVGNMAEVSVIDNGIGIAPDMLPQVFDMFTQVDRSLGKAQGGLGIGLHIAKQLVRMHGGAVEARSEGTGKGSEFIVRIPLALSDRA